MFSGSRHNTTPPAQHCHNPGPSRPKAPAILPSTGSTACSSLWCHSGSLHKHWDVSAIVYQEQEGNYTRKHLEKLVQFFFHRVSRRELQHPGHKGNVFPCLPLCLAVCSHCSPSHTFTAFPLSVHGCRLTSGTWASTLTHFSWHMTKYKAQLGSTTWISPDHICHAQVPGPTNI